MAFRIAGGQWVDWALEQEAAAMMEQEAAEITEAASLLTLFTPVPRNRRASGKSRESLER
jgi:hypothetical protein